MRPRTHTAVIGPVRVPDELADQADQVAAELGHTRSSLVRHAVRQFVEANLPDVIECGSHTVLVNQPARMVEIYSDSSASDREAQRDWHDVSDHLKALGVSDLEECGRPRGVDVFAGSF